MDQNVTIHMAWVVRHKFIKIAAYYRKNYEEQSRNESKTGAPE